MDWLVLGLGFWIGWIYKSPGTKCPNGRTTEDLN